MLWSMFLSFFKIGAFTFGGGFAMIPIIQDELVKNRKWMKEEEFIDAIAMAQASPGPIAVNVSIFCGYKMKGFTGALACCLGTVLPSFITILIIARFFYSFREYVIVDKVFKGIGAAVVSLIAAAVYKMYKQAHFGRVGYLISFTAILILVFLPNVSPIYLILLSGIGSIIINKFNEKNEKGFDEEL